LQARLDARWLGAADLPNGRRRFIQSRATCHILFGQGTRIGPDLTGVQRTILQHLLENIVDPSAAVAADYRMSTLVLTDGHVLNAIVNDRGGPTVVVPAASSTNRACSSIRRPLKRHCPCLTGRSSARGVPKTHPASLAPRRVCFKCNNKSRLRASRKRLQSEADGIRTRNPRIDSPGLLAFKDISGT
jgi:putative heme-binding domain-containing protein